MDKTKAEALREAIQLIKNPAIPWWPGDERVEKYMTKVAAALDRQGLTGAARTDIYNRAYEAVYAAIKDYAK